MYVLPDVPAHMCNRKQDVHVISGSQKHSPWVFRVLLSSCCCDFKWLCELCASSSQRLSQVSFVWHVGSLDMQGWTSEMMWCKAPSPADHQWVYAQESHAWTTNTEQQITKRQTACCFQLEVVGPIFSHRLLSSSGLCVFMPLWFCQICLLHQQGHVSGHSTKAAATSRHCQASSLESSWIETRRLLVLVQRAFLHGWCAIFGICKAVLCFVFVAMGFGEWTGGLASEWHIQQGPNQCANHNYTLFYESSQSLFEMDN